LNITTIFVVILHDFVHILQLLELELYVPKKSPSNLRSARMFHDVCMYEL
jgi:hypothetical protein